MESFDKLRIERALSFSSGAIQPVFPLLPLLLHIPHPNLTGYVADAPVGIADFVIFHYQKQYLLTTLTSLEANQSMLPHFSYRSTKAILEVYVMGSIDSISQTPKPDLETWVCHRDELSTKGKEALHR
ncbi:adenylate cyclase, partial [Pasteurella multocida]|nr:adenylate cyclase [Pasteurella multocida]